MKLNGLITGIVAFAVFASAAPDYSKYAKQLDVSASDLSVSDGVTLSNFPVLLRLSEAIDGFSYADFALENGGDLLVIDPNGNELAYEIDTWNEAGESLVWVKVPAFDNATKLHLLYGNAEHVSSVEAKTTWSDFTGVWHMNEASGAVADATGNGLTATPDGTVEEKLIAEMKADAGMVGNARVNQTVITSDYRNRLVVPNYDSFGLGDTFTISGWFHAYEIALWPRLFSRRGINNGWEQEIAAQDRVLNVFGWSGSSASINVDTLDDHWVYLVFAYDGSTVHCYSNGKLVSSATITPVQDNGSVLAIGGNAANNEPNFAGKYDEARLCDSVLDASRVAADYATVADAGFMTYGTAGDRVFSKVDASAFDRFLQIRVAANAAIPDATQFDVPVLVRLSEAISGFNYDDFKQAGGGDLVFTDENGIILPHEIDTWNEAGESVVWVKVPSLDKGCRIFAYYGSEASLASSAALTWSDYKAVWHMNQDRSETEIDATGNGLDAVPTGDDIQAMVRTDDAVVGSARVNQSSSDLYYCNYLLVPSYELGSTFTVSGWFKATALAGWHRFMSRKNTYGDDGWEFTAWAGESALDVYGSSSKNLKAPVSDLMAGWSYLTLVYDNYIVRVYQNGKEVASASVDPATDNGKVLAIGNNARGAERSFTGLYDEIRLGAGTLSAERIALDYAIVTDKEFLEYGTAGGVFDELPQVGEPVAIAGENGVAFQVSISGTAKLSLRFSSADGVYSFPLETVETSGARSYEVSVPEGLAQNTTFRVEAIASNNNGGEIIVASDELFYNGVLSVAKEQDAQENGLIPGRFVISRQDTNGALTVNYRLSGSAVSGVDYVNEVTGSVVIKNGESSCELLLEPLVNVAVNADTQVVLTLDEGFYLSGAPSVSMTILNLSPVRRSEFLRCMSLDLATDFLGETVLTNFPVLVKLGEHIPGFSYDDFKLADGADHIFTDGKGGFLASEVDTWNAEGISLIWVFVPELSADTELRLYYGNGANPAGIDMVRWPDYTGVWHMNEAAGKAFDATANGIHAMPVGNRTDLMVGTEGCIGSARVNQTATTYYGVQTNRMEIAPVAVTDVGQRFTVSGWFKSVEGFTEFEERMISRKVNFYDLNGWEVTRRSIYNSTEQNGVIARGGSETGVTTIGYETGLDWVHLLFVYDGPTLSIYVNGELSNSGEIATPSNDNEVPLAIGGDPTGKEHGFHGSYDELRLRSGAVPALWAEAEYKTVKDDSFIAYGTPIRFHGLMLLIK